MSVKPRILFILKNAWTNNLSLGNTLSNVFSGWDGEVASIYCRNERINNSVCTYYFRITERDFINRILKGRAVGQVVDKDEENKQYEDVIKKDYLMYEKAKKHRFQILLWGRELLWHTDLWKNKNLYNFIKEFNPDIVFLPLYDSFYTYRIAYYVMKTTGAQLMTYIGDDMYGFGKGHISPLYYIDVLIRRHYIRKSIKKAFLRLCLTKEQQDSYEKIFSVRFTLMKKGVNCSEKPRQMNHTVPYSIVFTGNINLGREETILRLAECLERINKDKIKASISVYTANTVSDKAKEFEKSSKSILFHPSVSAEEVRRIQQNADIVLHVESFIEKNKERVRYSLSTKIVDYLSLGKCILAIGPAGISSIEYLRRNDAAIIIDDLDLLDKQLNILLLNENLITDYETKAWNFACREHNISTVQEELYSYIRGEKINEENNN